MTSSTSITILSTEKLNTIMCTTSTIDSPRSVSSTVASHAISPQYHMGSNIDSPGSVSSTTYKNLCVDCGIDMGDQNPRQLCGKTICLYNPDSPQTQ